MNDNRLKIISFALLLLLAFGVLLSGLLKSETRFSILPVGKKNQITASLILCPDSYPPEFRRSDMDVMQNAAPPLNTARTGCTVGTVRKGRISGMLSPMPDTKRLRLNLRKIRMFAAATEYLTANILRQKMKYKRYGAVVTNLLPVAIPPGRFRSPRL